MSETRFNWSIGGIIVALLLSATPGVGAIIGLFFGFGIAFFVAGPCFLLAAILKDAGLPVTDKSIAILLAGLYALGILAGAARAWRMAHAGAVEEARRAIIGTGWLIAFPVIGWLSIQALADAWP